MRAMRHLTLRGRVVCEHLNIAKWLTMPLEIFVMLYYLRVQIIQANTP